MPVLPHLPPQLSQWLGQRVGQGLLFFFLMSFQPVLFWLSIMWQTLCCVLSQTFVSCSVPITTCEVGVSSISWRRNTRQEVESLPDIIACVAALNLEPGI